MVDRGEVLAPREGARPGFEDDDFFEGHATLTAI